MEHPAASAPCYSPCWNGSNWPAVAYTSASGRKKRASGGIPWTLERKEKVSCLTRKSIFLRKYVILNILRSK
jgi:hypothetical protein